MICDERNQVAAWKTDMISRKIGAKRTNRKKDKGGGSRELIIVLKEE